MMLLLPPAPDCCQVCAVKHKPTEPHNAQSLYYQMKHHQDHGRWPTWRDAIAHCTEAVQAHWIKELGACGVDVDSPNVNAPASAHPAKDHA